MNGTLSNPRHTEPRWPAAMAVIAVGGLRLVLPESLSAGPNWLILAVIVVLLVPTIWARLRGSHGLNQALDYVLNGIITADMEWSLWLLISFLPSRMEAAMPSGSSVG